MVILATAGQRHEALMLRKLMEAGAVKDRAAVAGVSMQARPS
jgi:hypothetical protein